MGMTSGVGLGSGDLSAPLSSTLVLFSGSRKLLHLIQPGSQQETVAVSHWEV